jgi:hypothetical protein
MYFSSKVAVVQIRLITIKAIGSENDKMVECYDPFIDRWTFITPLPEET